MYQGGGQAIEASWSVNVPEGSPCNPEENTAFQLVWPQYRAGQSPPVTWTLPVLTQPKNSISFFWQPHCIAGSSGTVINCEMQSEVQEKTLDCK